MNNFLEKTRCYEAGPIQCAKDQNWRNYVSDELKKLNITPYNPLDKPLIDSFPEGEEIHAHLKECMKTGRYAEVQDFIKKVRRQDLSLIDRSDFVIAFFDPTVCSIGTAEELSFCERSMKPTFICIDGGISKAPYWIFAMFNLNCFFNSIEEVIEKIKKLNSGEDPIDDKYWRLLKKEYR